MNATMLDYLAVARPTLTTAEQRVADHVASDPQGVVDSTLSRVAAECSVSEPTVLRFCRSLGYSGFSEFRIRLAQNLGPGWKYADIDLDAAESGAVTSLVVAKAIDALWRLSLSLNRQAVEAASQAIARARRVEFYGLGASGIVAQDAHQKFFRLVPACAAFSDSHTQIMSAATLDAGDVAVLISHTGLSRELIDTMRVANRVGATTVAITSSNNYLGEHCNIVLTANDSEDTSTFTPMLSRIVHLVIIDILAVSVAELGGAVMTKRSQKMKAALRTKRMDRPG